MKKILLTGGNGFFASRFTKFYENKYNILALSHKDLDITDEDKTYKAIKEFAPDYVIHTAGIANTNFCEENPAFTYDINVNGTLNVGKACKDLNCKMIFLSSEQVYNGNMEEGPYTENIKPIPNTEYGKQKLEAENKIKNILDELWILRFTWLFGLPEKNCKVNANIVSNMINSILNGKDIKEPVNEYRGMTYIYELIENFEKIFDIPYGIYNIGSENNLNRYECACLVLKGLGLENRLDCLIKKDFEKYKDKPRDLRISNQKLKDQGIKFSLTKDAILKCLSEFNYKL
ncbi:SDR family oxidoreductase [Clostridium oceanicum]|uniref:dTDP-4-dehydrorhamnose reductase n=1 Tax=Clostridium oceanicum TaxID=1543 RepID=A0ABN1JJ07_9CLOT